METGPRFDLSPSAAAAEVGVHPDTLKKWAGEGRIRAFRTPGGWWRFNRDDVRELVRTLTHDVDEAVG